MHYTRFYPNSYFLFHAEKPTVPMYQCHSFALVAVVGGK